MKDTEEILLKQLFECIFLDQTEKAIEIISSDECTEELMCYRLKEGDKIEDMYKGYTILHVSISKNNFELATYILDSNKCTPKLINNITDSNSTCLYCASTRNLELFKKVLHHSMFDKQLCKLPLTIGMSLMNSDNVKTLHKTTFLMTCTKLNPSVVKYFMDTEYCDYEMLHYSCDCNECTNLSDTLNILHCLLVTPSDDIEFDDSSDKNSKFDETFNVTNMPIYIMEHNKCTTDLIKSKFNYMSVFSVACRNSPRVSEYMIHRDDFYTFVDDDFFPSVCATIHENTNIIKVILGSSKITKEMINKRVYSGGKSITCIDYAVHHDNNKLIEILINHDLFDIEMLVKRDEDSIIPASLMFLVLQDINRMKIFLNCSRIPLEYYEMKLDVNKLNFTTNIQSISVMDICEKTNIHAESYKLLVDKFNL
jgi:hypothetical protein